jgi:uncharacterized membrane protein
MSHDSRGPLERWLRAGLIDPATADRIRAFEAEQDHGAGLGWPVRIALGLGGLLLGAGILLFVEAQWDVLSPFARFLLVLSMVGALHAAAASVGESLPVLSSMLHAVGTIALGAGIFLCGQIFNLDEHWPSGFLLWAVGAAAGFALLRDSPQLGLAAVLWPAWLASEWIDDLSVAHAQRPLAAGLVLLAVTYFTATTREQRSEHRRMLQWIGGIALVPMLVMVIAFGIDRPMRLEMLQHAPGWLAFGWGVALLLPLGLGRMLHGRWPWEIGVAAAWVIVLVEICTRISRVDESPWLYLWCGVGAIGMVAWGVRETVTARINVGVLLFALTLLAYYFTNVFDKLDRAASLLGLGVLFVGVGFALERTRRRLVRRAEGAMS